MTDDAWTDNILTCYCGRITARVVTPTGPVTNPDTGTTTTGEHIRWICPEHGQVGEFIRVDAGELDVGIVRAKPIDRQWVWGLIVILVAVLIAVVALATQDSRDDSGSQILTSESVATTPPTVWQTTNLPPPLTVPAEVATTARRADFQEQITTPPPFDPVAYVNGLAYCHACMPPAMEAYRVVALTRGWSDQQIDARAAFVEIIMATESGGCWNVRRWGYGSIGQDCKTLCKGGRKGECAYDDAGFGQITNILRTPTSPLCAIEGICSPEATVASPWSSMTAFLRVLEDGGKTPWCYLNNSHVRNGHCRLWPG